MNASYRFLSVFLIISLMFGCSALADQTGTAAGEAPAIQSDSPAGLFLALSEKTTHSMTFPLTEAQAAQVEKAGADRVTWTLHRVAPYANPADGKFNPIHGEERMFPHERETIDFATITYGEPNPYDPPFSMERFETRLEDATLKLDFTTSPAMYAGKEGMPHASGGIYLDICGQFILTAELDGMTLATLENVTIKPYASFHTMWEIYDELLRLADEGDDDSATPEPYVEYGVMGQSYHGYDMPYLIVARDSRAVQKWLDLSQQAEETGTAVIEALRRSVDTDYQVPILYSNIHANEVAATDAVLEFARLLIEEPAIDYTKLTGFTEEGQAACEAQRAALGLHTPELVAGMSGYLGSIWPKADKISGRVEGFDRYYTTEKATVTVADLLDDVIFILVPEENVEARMYYTRAAGCGYDLNRDNCFQTMPETQNMQHLIGSYDPVTLVEVHGQVGEFQVEPCTPPHEPNGEYDLLARHLMAGGEAFGAAAVANNPEYQSYTISMRDLMFSDGNGDVFWERVADDISSCYTPQFAMLHGCVGYTVELPAYSEVTRQAATYGLLGLSDYVAANKESYFADLAEIYARGAENRNSDAQVGPWFVDEHDNAGADALVFRPAHAGEDENGQFFPECYLIPLDAEHQSNLQAAFDMIEWLTRNDVKVGVASAPVVADGRILPAGTAVVSMYQAKRSVANEALYGGIYITDWSHLCSEGITAFNHTRGFDMVTCVKPAEYDAIAGSVDRTLTWDSVQPFLRENAVSRFNGEKGGDVIISNASESATAAVNTLLRSGKQVGMITEGANVGDFICAYADWQSVSNDYILTGTGVKDPDCTAYVIGKAPTVYISGTREALTPDPIGYVYTALVSFFFEYNYDRMAMDMMGFDTTEDAARADAVVGATALDAEGLAAVQAGVPYVGYTDYAMESVQDTLLPELQTGYTDGLDCLGYVTYPEETLVNASYIRDGDDVFYGSGTSYFTALPEGAKVLVRRDGSRPPLEGFLNGDPQSRDAFLNGIMGLSYTGKDKAGNDVSLTLFANSLTNKAHQRDEYAFISNALFAGMLTETPYVTTVTP